MMKITVGILLGLLGGLLIYLEAAMLFSSPGEGPSGPLIAFTFLGGTALCAYLMVKGAKTVSKVFARGSLIGAALWLLMIVAGAVLSGRAVTETTANTASHAAQAGAAIGGGLVAIFTGGVSIFMVMVCLVSFLVFHLLGRELKAEVAEGPTKKCPQCAELVKAEAIKCKHCGAIIGPEAAVSTT